MESHEKYRKINKKIKINKNIDVPIKEYFVD
jgi:hypothetical protein